MLAFYHDATDKKIVVTLNEETIGEQLNAIQNQLTGDQQSISNKEIEIIIYNNNLPPITLIDLPGFTHNRLDD